ncbi:MAG: outer membrane beta-barrel protein, partial [Thermoguttaceae bacterium]|nr:outer membrane beta-barrel protein [Thermoguttaceae bacterium]
DDDSEFIWQSDQEVRQTGMMLQAPATAPGAVKSPPKAPLIDEIEAAPPKPLQAAPPKPLPTAPVTKPKPPAPPAGPLPDDPAYRRPAPPPSRLDEGPAQAAGPSMPGVPCWEECEPDDTSEPRRFFSLPALDCRRIGIYGWLDQGFTWNPDSPRHRFNGPVTFNDRANEYMLNQLYLIGERKTDTSQSDFDFGGRVDVLYGTDHRFLMGNGLEVETNADGSIEQAWNRDHRFYGLAMPQVYADLAWNDWVFRFGRFYTIVGYENGMAPDHFFYSHSYTKQYGEPFTHTGMLARWSLNERLSVGAGFHRGWDQWEDNNDKLGVLGDIAWTGPEGNTSLALGIVSSNEQPTGESSRNLVSMVWTQKLTGNLKCVLQGDIAHEQNALPDGQDAEWWGVVGYLLYDIDPCWSLGFRYEWFSDDDGVRVAGLGDPTNIALFAVPSHWQEASLGLNYKPNANVLLRSEVRWDWADPLVATVDAPFGDYDRFHQFLWGTDLIIQF